MYIVHILTEYMILRNIDLFLKSVNKKTQSMVVKVITRILHDFVVHLIYNKNKVKRIEIKP